jgi:hypothetical protein
MTQEDQVFIVNVMVTDPTQETMALNVTNQLTSVMAERRTIVKIRKYKGLHEGHHFIPMAMKVYMTHPKLLDGFNYKSKNEDSERKSWVAVATLLWPSVEVKPNTWKKRGFGVLRDSRMFRAQQQAAKHLALGCSWCHWKDLDEGYNFGSDLVAIRGRGEELCPPKVPGVHNRDTWVDFGTPTWESREFVPFGCGCGGASQRIL